jgi:hypothetical protein
MAEDDSLLAVVAGGTVDRVTCRRRRRGSRWTWWRRAHLGWPLPRRDRVESAGWLPLHPVVAHRGTGSVLPLIEEVVLTATLTTSPSVVHLRHVADLAPEDRVGLPTSRSADPATHPPSHLLGGSPCVRWVSVRTSSSATWAYADDRTPCGPISALSRWRHGFESRWGCHKKDLVRGLLARSGRPRNLRVGAGCQSCANPRCWRPVGAGRSQGVKGFMRRRAPAGSA